MDLEKYLSEHSTQRELAAALGVTPGFVSQWVNGVRPIPIDHCFEIESVSNQLVRCEDLRPEMNWTYLRQQRAAAA